MYFRSVHSDVALARENLPEPSVSFSGLSSCSRTISPGVLPAFHLFVISATTSLSSFYHLVVEAPQSTCDLPPGLRGTVNTSHVQSPSPWSRFFLSSWRTKPRVTRVHLHGAVSDWRNFGAQRSSSRATGERSSFHSAETWRERCNSVHGLWWSPWPAWQAHPRST